MDEISKELIPKFDLLGLNAYLEINKRHTLDQLEGVKITEKGVSQVINKDNVDKEFILGGDYLKFFPNAEPRTILDLAILLAKNRPSMAINIEGLVCDIKDNRLNEVLTETNQELIFQEQAIQILSNCLNVSLSESVDIYKEIIKKSDDYKAKRESYVAQICENGEGILSYLEFAAPDLFNKSQAISYALVDYYSFN